MNTDAKPQRVAIVTPYGAEPRFDNYAEFILAQTLIERGWKVRMHTYAARGIPTYTGNFTYKTVPVFRCRHRFGISPRLFFSILFFRPEVVIGLHPKSSLNFSAYLAARCVGARFMAEIVGILHDPYIVTNTDDPTGNFRDPIVLITSVGQLIRRIPTYGLKAAWHNYITHTATAHADTIIAISEDERKYVKKFYNRDSVCIYWCTPRHVTTAQEKPPVAVPERYLFFIGMVKRRKGWDTAIDALAALKARGHMEHLVFVTPHKDLTEPTVYARQKGVLDQITFRVAVSNEEKNWLYAHATYMLIPSRYEGFGIPVFEAFMARKPICATTINVFLEFLSDKENAMLSAIGDGEAMARSVEALDADPELQKKLVVRGQQTAEEFGYTHMVDKYVALIGSGQKAS